MSTAENIRSLAREGLSVKEIAERLGIRYQHARSVLERSNMLPPPRVSTSRARKRSAKPATTPKPPLPVEKLVGGGFALSARWILSDAGELAPDHPLPEAAGVYAFAKEGTVLYVGVAKMGLAKRLYFYARPGKGQVTSQRLNRLIKEELFTHPSIDIYTAMPTDLEWNGLPVHGSAGLELGLITTFTLPWNKQNAG